MSKPAETKIILLCVGHNSESAGQVEHWIEIDGKKAMFDGKPYTVQETPILFTFEGPIGAWQPGGGPEPAQRIQVNRLTGEYIVFDAKSPNDSRDRTRPGDSGCRKVTQKF
jgi:hypothetical protein